MLVVRWQYTSYDLVRFLLSIQSFSIVTELEVGMGDGLVATGDLDVIFPKEVDVSVQAVHETINRSLELLEILVHES